MVKDVLREYIKQLTTDREDNQREHPFYQTMFDTLIDNAPVGMYIWMDDALVYVNRYYANLLGYTKEELTNGEVNIESIVHPDDFPLSQTNINKRLQGEEKEVRYKIRQYKKNGRLIYTEVHASAAEMYGKVVLFGTIIDITEQVEAQQLLQESNDRYEALLHNSPDAIFTFQNDGTCMSANPASEALTGYSLEELKEMFFMPLVSANDLAKTIKHFEDAKAGISSSSNLVMTRKDGECVHINATHFPMKINGEIVGTYGIARDITQKILYDQHMEQLAFYDPLTNLPNRKLFEDRLGQIIKFSRGEQDRFAVLFLDLDRFKFINDSLGHHIGDEFLKMVSERLKHSLRSTDTISRLAGDEFTILLPKTSQAETIKVVEQLNHVLTEPFNVGGHSVTISASIGIVFSKGSEDRVHDLIRNADTAMYYTKKFRRNGYTIYSEELDLKASQKLVIERDLKLAIENEEFELHYQPIVDLKAEKLIAVEALIRWHHPELGLVPPSDFIPVAEESGQMITVGTWVLQTACRQNKNWQDSGVAPFKVAVNISSKQLQDASFVERVLNTLNETGLEAKWLELEVTESILLEDVEFIKESLMKLKQEGISISIDDFGTGYTSLSYLRQYPFDKVKVDRTFIDDISADLNGKRITSAIISLAHSLKMDVVAEGIENEVQLRYLKEEACDEGQGYYFSQPMPGHALKLHLP